MSKQKIKTFRQIKSSILRHILIHNSIFFYQLLSLCSVFVSLNSIKYFFLQIYLSKASLVWAVFYSSRVGYIVNRQ